MRMRVSLCMIVKNEEANLPVCLGSAADLMDEIIVVDTGSKDRTKELATRFGSRVFDFTWCDDFAAARNESLRHATGDWIFWLDADDHVDVANRPRLQSLLRDLRDENLAYIMTCRCLKKDGATIVEHPRLFRNRPDIRWQSRIHEQILPAVRRTGGTTQKTDIIIQHGGYQDDALHQRKLERNLRILHLENAEHPDDPWCLLNLGQNYLAFGRAAEAAPYLRRCLECSHPAESYVRKLYGQLVRCQHQLGQRQQGVATCREGLSRFGDYGEMLFMECQFLDELGDFAGAEAGLKRLLDPVQRFVSDDEGLLGYKARQNLGAIYRKQNRIAEAEAQWTAVLAERPDFLPAWLALGDLWLSQGRQAELERAIRRLQEAPYGAAIATRLSARILQIRK